MKIQYFNLITLFLLLLTLACKPAKDENFVVDDPKLIHQSMNKLTEIMVHDIFSPPVASRIYAYSSIAAYEALAHNYPEYRSLAGQINELEEGPAPEAGKEYCFPLSGIHAFLQVGKALIFSEDVMEAYAHEVYQKYQNALSEDVYERSMAYGDEVAQHILAWASKDNYNETRTFPKFTVMDEPGRWQPTPPDYMDGIEPHWNKIRTLVLDSARQFPPEKPTKFDMGKGSQFYKEALEVYETDVNLTQEQADIASFWDCNPYVSHHQGHVMFATKKITPGGHWMGITSIAAQKDSASLMETVRAYTLVSIALFDGFISCWDEKYYSNLIRPETVINTYIDEEWAPLLQTPPFPEYPSGHSVISSSAAIALTHLYGDKFHFVDSTEVAYGLAPREFNSFIEASEEAAISRLYGGIHYMPAIENGVAQGRKVGDLVVNKVQMKRSDSLVTSKH